MKVMVKGKEKELTIIDKVTGSDWACDFCEYDKLQFIKDGYAVMSAREFAYWEKEIRYVQEYVKKYPEGKEVPAFTENRRPKKEKSSW